jgi:glucose/arabinose dehydrogenase
MATRSTHRVIPRDRIALTLLPLVVAALFGCEATSSDPLTPAEEGPPDGPVSPLATSEAGLCRGIALPADQAFVADGLCVRAVALDQGKLRQITFSMTGDLIGVTYDGQIRRYRDVNDDGMFSGPEELRQLAITGGKNGNNAAFDAEETYLYAGTPDGVRRWRYSSALDELGAGEDIVVGQPSSGTHQLHTVHVYDDWLYVQSGSEGNAFHPMLPDYDTERAVLKRFRIADFDGVPFDWSDGELYYGGLRNMVGFTRNPKDGELYGVVNGLDDLVYAGKDVHLDNPGEDLVRLERGMSHGYPYCFTAQHIERENGMVVAGSQLASDVLEKPGEPAFENPHDDAWCEKNSSEPLTFFPAHSAPLEVIFVDDAGALPSHWQDSALVALHGSWDTEPSVGHQVVRVPLSDAGTMAMPAVTLDGALFPHEVIFGGAVEDGLWGWASGPYGEYPVRPVGLAISPVDGALYVSSDNASIYQGTDSEGQGVLYRIARIER